MPNSNMKQKIANFIECLNAKFPKDSHFPAEGYMTIPGRKYTKIVRERNGVPTSAYGFIDNSTGDLYKAASYAAPAKHSRGSILDSSGLLACHKYSVAYLR